MRLETALADSQAAGDRGREAECLRLLGVAAFDAGDGDAGFASMRAALRIARSLGDRRLEAAILVDWATGHWRRAEYASSLTLLDEALAIQVEEGDLQGQAEALVMKGRVYFKEGAYEQALEYHRQALSIQEGRGDRRAQAVTLEDVGDVFNDRHEYATALEWFDRSLRLREAIGDLPGQAWIHLVIGSCYLLQGAPRAAAVHFQASFDIAARLGEPALQAAALYHLAGVDRRQGRRERAIAGYRRALALHEELGDRRAAAWDHAMIGICCGSLGDLDQAAAHHERARDIRAEIGDLRNLADSLEALADVRLAQDRVEEAERLYREAAALGDQISLPYLSMTLGKLALVLARQGNGREALQLGQRAVSDALLLESPSLRCEAHYWLGLTQRELGRLDAAASSLIAALDAVDELRTAVSDEEEARTWFLEDKQRLYTDTVEVLLRLDRPADALEVAERSRARALVEMLRREGRGNAIPEDGAGKGDAHPHDLADDSWLERMLGTTSRSGSATSASMPAIEAAAGTVGARPAAPARVEEYIRQARVRGATIVEYLLADQTLYMWVVAPDSGVRATSVSVRRERLATLVAAAGRVSAMADGQPQSADHGVHADQRPAATADAGALEALRELHRLLVEPVAAWLPVDPRQLVVVVPHGPLHTLSFAALVDAGGRFLVERHTLAFVPAIDVLSLLGELSPSATIDEARVLLVANPAAPTHASGSLPKLPGADREVDAISRLFPPSRVVVVRGEGAREERVRAMAPGFDVIHLATHGVVRDDEPFESWLLLSGGNGESGPTGAGPTSPGEEPASDGRWTAREIAAEKLTARLVVLSACNTGLGKVTGDGVIGLSRAFLVAGVPTLVVSLWRVSDVVAGFQMEAFYKALRAGKGSTSAALRAAQLATRQALREGELRAEDGRPLPDHPALWAPFVVVGEGGNR